MNEHALSDEDSEWDFSVKSDDVNLKRDLRKKVATRKGCLLAETFQWDFDPTGWGMSEKLDGV